METKPWKDIKAGSKPDVVTSGEARARATLARMEAHPLDGILRDQACWAHLSDPTARDRYIVRDYMRTTVCDALQAFVAAVKAREFYNGGINDEEAGGYKAALAVMDEELAKWLTD